VYFNPRVKNPNLEELLKSNDYKAVVMGDLNSASHMSVTDTLINKFVTADVIMETSQAMGVAAGTRVIKNYLLTKARYSDHQTLLVDLAIKVGMKTGGEVWDESKVMQALDEISDGDRAATNPGNLKCKPDYTIWQNVIQKNTAWTLYQDDKELWRRVKSDKNAMFVKTEEITDEMEQDWRDLYGKTEEKWPNIPEPNDDWRDLIKFPTSGKYRLIKSEARDAYGFRVNHVLRLMNKAIENQDKKRWEKIIDTCWSINPWKVRTLLIQKPDRKSVTSIRDIRVISIMSVWNRIYEIVFDRYMEQLRNIVKTNPNILGFVEGRGTQDMMQKIRLFTTAE